MGGGKVHNGEHFKEGEESVNDAQFQEGNRKESVDDAQFQVGNREAPTESTLSRSRKV